MERAPATLQAYLLPWVRVLFCLQYQRGLTETASRRFFRTRRDGRVVEGARLESVYRGNSIEGSNPSLSAMYDKITGLLETRDSFQSTPLRGSPRVTYLDCPERPFNSGHG